MSYETNFWGRVTIDPPLSLEERAEFAARMEWDWGSSAPPQVTGRPSAPCHWACSAEGDAIEWDGIAKFYDYERWMTLLIDDFFEPRRHVLDGSIRCSGEAEDDESTLSVTKSVVTVALHAPIW